MIELFATYRRRLAFLLALLVPVGIAAVLVPFRGNFTTTAAALVLVACVVAIAVIGSRVSGFVASVSAALWFDFFLTRPYYQFAISHRPDLETTIAIFIVGVIVTELAARSRHHSLVSDEESTYVLMVRDLTDLAARSSRSTVVIENVERSLVSLLDLRACRFDTTLANPPLARIVSSGAVIHVGLDWPVGDIGIPGPEAEIVAEWRGRALGRFILTPSSGQPVSLERRVVAVLLASVVGASLATENRVA
ncbi:MAG TPA: DUF4118 domain-containing protein [Acidimicrobiales bacterium]|jgi:hypothetical protein|nr:DUF4118 domain-containing protein [Acidimicrobiales bacterium]